MIPRDVPAALELSTGAGWNQTARDWRTLLALAPETCFAMDCDGALDGSLAATATLVCYGTKLAWVGMVLTRPDYRRRGLATILLKEALRAADERGVETVKLDATEMGRPLYGSLGFEPEQPVERWWRDEGLFATGVHTSVDTVTTDADGFLFTRPGRLARYLGPCVAGEAESARRMIGGALSNDSAWCWDLLPENRAALELAREFGFTPTRKLVRMTRGKPLRRQSERIYAIAGFELG